MPDGSAPIDAGHMRAQGEMRGLKARIHISLDPDQFHRLSRLAYKHNVPVAALMRQMIMRQLEAVEGGQS